MMRRLPHLLVLLCLSLVACGDDKVGPSGFVDPDAGGDLDAGDDVLDVADTGPDAVPDAQPDNSPDLPDLPELPPPDEWEQGAWMIGRSVENRPLVAEHYGVAGPVLFLLSGIHGNERSSVTLGEQYRAILQGGIAEREGIRVVFIPAANPDGIAISKRHNAHDIDLNRNFPADNFDPSAGGGSTPLSEPESRALRAAVDLMSPTAVISGHCCIPIMDYDGPARDLSAAMAAAMDPDFRFPVDRLGSRPGSFGSYVGIELDLPIITLEFALDGQMDTVGQLLNVERAVGAAMLWVADNGETPDATGVSALELPDSPLDAFVVTESAGGLLVRAESYVQGSGDPILLLSGLVDNDRRALNVSEHIRRELIANIPDIPMVMVTAANPDGIDANSTLNSSGDDVPSDFFEGTLTSPEAEALDALFDSYEPRLVVHVHAAETDRVASLGLSPSALEGAIPAQLEDAGGAVGPLADWLDDRGIALVDLGVNEPYGRGDNTIDDFFAEGDPAIYSVLVRRIIKPELACLEDAFCDALCDVDPDCDGECACDFNPICEAAARGSDVACTCDPDCDGGLDACTSDAACDSWCPANVDPDCACNCSFTANVCEPRERESTDACRCDLDCADGGTPCVADAHCDTWCPEGTDPDCS